MNIMQRIINFTSKYMWYDLNNNGTLEMALHASHMPLANVIVLHVSKHHFISMFNFKDC